MKLVEYEERLESPLRQATLCLLRRGEEILLARKERGFGEGRWNGLGGKPEGEEPIEKTMVREAEEEAGVTPTSFRHVATLNFYFPHHPDFNQQVLVFIAEAWNGDPAETEEMKPQWFNLAEIPYDQMWPDDILWLPEVLNGRTIMASFMFGEGDKVLEYWLKDTGAVE